MITDPKKRQERRESMGAIKDEMNARRREKAKKVAEQAEHRRKIDSGELVEDGKSGGKKRRRK